MSICKGRLYFGIGVERRLQDSDVIQTLNFQDSDDGDMDSSVNDASMESVSPQNNSMNSADRSPQCWDSALDNSPTPVSNPRNYRRSPRRKMISPLPFSFDDSEDEQHQQTSCDTNERLPPLPRSPFTPPHKKMGSLRLYDTPHTPKSLLQKAQRRITRVQKSKLNIIQDSTTPKLMLNPSRPQTNVNPFTPTTPGSGTTGMKRPRYNSSNNG